MNGETFDSFRDLEDIKIPALPGHYRINCVQYMSEFEKKHWTYRCEVRSDDRFMRLAERMKDRESSHKINYTFFTIHAEATGESTYSYNLQTYFNAEDPSTRSIPDTGLLASVEAMLSAVHQYITNMLSNSQTFKTISENITGVHLFDQIIMDDRDLITKVTFPIVPNYKWVMSNLEEPNGFTIGLNPSSARSWDRIQICVLSIIPQRGEGMGKYFIRTRDGKFQGEDANNSIISICQAVVDLYTERAVNAMKAGTPLMQVFNSNFPDRQVLSALSKLTDIIDQLVK